MDNRLDVVHPELAQGWSDKNLPLTPDDVTYGSNRKVWWEGFCGHEWQASPKSRREGHGCPYCSGNAILLGFNDFASTYPTLAKEWSDKNTLEPDSVTANSSQSVLWCCSEGHEWRARIADRVNGSKCPYCSGAKLLSGFNDLKTKRIELAEEWSVKNIKGPENYSPKSRKNVWWKCPDCDYEYKAVIYSRVQGLSCPVCTDNHVSAGINDLLTTNAELCAEWDYEKNGNMARPIFPDKVSKYSMYSVWWHGSCGHEWKARICDRVLKHEGCLECEREFLDALPSLATAYYAEKAHLKLIPSDKKLTGISIDAYFPELSLLMDFDRGYSETSQKSQTVKQIIADTKGMTYTAIQWKGKRNAVQLLTNILKALSSQNIILTTDIKADLTTIRNRYKMWRH